jgi:hypothetical protein
MQKDEEGGGEPRRPSPPRRRHSNPAASRRPRAPFSLSPHAPLATRTSRGRGSEEFAIPRDARPRGCLVAAGVASLRLPPSASGLKLSRRNRVVRVLGWKRAGDVERVTWTNGTRDAGCSGEWRGSTWMSSRFCCQTEPFGSI